MKKIIFAGSLLLLPLNVFATPVQGNLGTTSTGKLDVELNIAPVVKISNLKDITVNYTPGVTADNTLGGTYGVSSACIYTNKADKKYFVTASSTNSFKVKQGTDLITYAVTWHNDDKVASTAGTALTNGVKSSEFTLSAAVLTIDCSSGASDNAGIKIKFTKTDLDLAKSGKYTDTLTLLVTPN